MTDILCKWLNDEIKISTRVDPTNFAREFSTGFLIGEVLEKYQLQDDFDQFSQSRTADSKLNNFTRVEPILHLLEVPFDTNVARDIMTEKTGGATRLMYQLFIALNKKQKNNLTGVAMETMRPAAPVKLENVESLIYKERLKHMTPRQTDLNLEALVERYHQKQVQMETVAFRERFEEEEKYMQRIQEQRENLRQKYRDERARKSDMLAKIHCDSASTEREPISRAATVHIPKPPANKTAKAIAQTKQARRQQEAEMTYGDIEEFEDKLKRTLPPSKPIGDDADKMAARPDSVDLIKPGHNDDYINKIRKRLNEDVSARAEREKRRRKVLVDQLKAHEAQEEACREEMLVNRLMRQSQQERRIAVQLLQARREKETIRRNRLLREKQYEDRRLKEFQEALNREAEMARLAKLEYQDQTEKDRELHNQIMAQQAEARYTKHYNMCGQVLGDMLDMTTKVGEYRELTNKLLPEKLMREWKLLFTTGQPLYESAPEVGTDGGTPTPEQILEEERQQLLDEGDFNEYRNMIGAWQPPEGCEVTGPPRNNPVVGHIIQRLFNIVHPPSPPPPAPEFPPFPIKACVMGKLFSGKSSACKQLAELHRLQVLDVEALVAEAVEAHKSGEVVEVEEPEDVPESEAPSIAATPKPEGSTVEGKTTPPDTAQDGSAPASKVTTPQVTSAKPAAASSGSAEPPQSAPDNREQEETASKAEDDGMEKGDPEKPVPEEEEPSNKILTVKTGSVKATKSARSTTSKNSKLPPKPQASDRAKLGMKAMKYLKKGRTVDDQLLIDILIEAIRRVPEGTGYIIDGFPTTYSQAKLLEKALTGMDIAASRETSKLSLKGKNKKSALAPDPKPAPPPPEPSSGLNVVVLFDLPNDVALKRSAGRTYATQEDEQYHQEFRPPPEGSATGIGKQEKVLPVEDTSHDQDQIQTRLTTFQDSWPKLEKWFAKFGTLQKVDASQEQETVFLELENILEQTLQKLQGPPPEETLTLETEPKEEEKPPEPEIVPEPVPETKPEEKPEEGRSRPTSKKGSRAGSAKRSVSSGGGSADRKGKKSPARSASKGDAKKSAKGSRGSSPKSPKRSKSGSKKSKTPEPEPEPEPEIPPGTPPPQPGSDLWEYVDEPIDEEMASILAPHWENVESNYIDGSKVAFRKVREEQEMIVRYLYELRQAYLAYLHRPDHKQEFVSQWQKEFNEVADDLRDDEETRGELHQRVDDLRERLWSICDERKEQAEKEREAIMSEGWAEDHIGLIVNLYISMMQTEVDRFQDTSRLLKDYYRGMEGKIPDELMAEYIRVPLIEIPVEQIPAEGEQSDSVEEEATESVQGDSKPASKAGTPSGKKKKAEDKVPEEDEGEEKRRIPLVPRRPVSPDPSGAGGKGKVEKSKPKGKDAGEDTPPPPADPDEKLLYDGLYHNIQAVDKIIAAEQAAREAEEEAERQREMEREAEKLKAATEAKKKGAKGGKGGKKSRSPSPKKGKGKDTPTQPTPPPESNEESEEEKQKKLTKERAKQEFFAAIQEEASAAKSRMELVRFVGNECIKNLKNKSDSAYKDMNDWLGARFLKEMESIDQMSEVMRFAIENGTKVRQELTLQQEEFVVNEDVLIYPGEDVKVLRTPTPQPPPQPLEQVEADIFTVNQIMNIHNQFALMAPTGMLSLRSFQEVFTDLTTLTYGSEEMPEMWLNLSPDKLESLAGLISSDGEYIDWRGFLLQASQPWPLASQSDLLRTLASFREMDQTEAGYVTREQYDRVDLWFSPASNPVTPDDPQVTPDDPQEPPPYDRLGNLKAAFFDIFSDQNADPPHLDYVSMLMYFSMSTDPYEGFLRALSVASGTHMPRLPDKAITITKTSRPGSQASTSPTELDTDRAVGADDNKLTEDIPESAVQAVVPLDALDRVLHHGQSMRGDSHRFSVTSDPEDAFSRERLAGVYQDLGSENLDSIAFSVLIEHPIIQDIITTCNTYRAVELRVFLQQAGIDLVDAQSLKTGE